MAQCVAGRQRQLGLGIIEAGLLLGLAASLFLGIGILFSSSKDVDPIEATLADIAAIRGSVSAIYKEQHGYGGVNPNLIALSPFLPPHLIYGREAAAALQSRFGFPFGIMPSPDDQRYLVILGNLPRPACIKLATTGLGAGLVSMYVAGGSKPVVAVHRPLTAEEARIACGGENGRSEIAFAGDLYPNSVVVWTFR